MSALQSGQGLTKGQTEANLALEMLFTGDSEPKVAIGKICREQYNETLSDAM